jgi:D-glycero-alpha-D-manno-heptose 1-phosphate guanylyltransferase
VDAIVLAGGLGTRLRSVVPDVPKPMAPVGGRPFLEHQLEYWIGQGVDRFILSTGYLHESIATHFGYTFQEATIDYAVEAQPLGTGGGMLLAAEQLSGSAPFLVLNGDTFLEVSLDVLRRCHERCEADLTMCLFRSEQEGRYTGVELDEQDRVVSLSSAVPGELSNAGVYLVNRAVFTGLGRTVGMRVSLENELLPAALSQGRRIFGLACSGRFIDIGVPHDYVRAATVLEHT